MTGGQDPRGASRAPALILSWASSPGSALLALTVPGSGSSVPETGSTCSGASRAAELIKGLQHLSCEENMRELGLDTAGWTRPQRPFPA